MNSAVFEFDGRFYRPTELARGPWDPRAQHGGAPAALLADRMARGAAAGRLVRLTVEFVRPVPLTPLALELDVTRAGRQVQRSEARLLADGVEVARAEGLHLRSLPGSGTPPPDVIQRAGELAPPPPPDEAAPAPPHVEYTGFGRGAVDVRFVRGAFLTPGPATAWFRLKVALVAGERPTPFARVAAAADFGNGIASALPWDTHVFANADLTIAVQREPVGEWIALDSVTRVAADGIGVAESHLRDAHGAIGLAHQSLLLNERPRP